MVKEQAKQCYAACMKEVDKPSQKPFKAYNSWLTKFLNGKEFNHVKLSGERGTADNFAADTFPNLLKRIIEEGSYTSVHIFNLDECGLNWKKMPHPTYISGRQKQAHGRKLDKSRVTVMFTVNVKPVIVHTARRPHCFSDVRSMDSFNDFYWYKSNNGWRTCKIMREWMQDHFVPDFRLKCSQLNILFKALLLMDNAPCHP